MSHAIICIVEGQADADRIVEVLRTSGFNNDHISALVPNGGEDKSSQPPRAATKATEHATTGAKTGLIIGGALGLLAGVGFLAIPGLGPFIAAGPLMALLSGAALGGSAGGVAGGLIGLGVHEDDAKLYESKLRDGNILLSVHTESVEEATRAEEILKSNGARDVKRSKKKVESAK
jgi:hypothetical protein